MDANLRPRICSPLAPLLAGTSSGASPAWLTAHDTRFRALVARMTLEEKAGTR